MCSKFSFCFLVLLIIGAQCYCQILQDSTSITPKIDTKSKKTIKYSPIAPAKAAFYSAVLPGLGQVYNKKYWKVPVIYAFLGTGIYFYINNDNEYNRYRDAYKSRLAGYTSDEFYGDTPGSPRVSNDVLIRAQRLYKKNKEISLLVTIGIYALNIIEANVNAHLLQFSIDDDLTATPHFNYTQNNFTNNVGITLNYNF